MSTLSPLLAVTLGKLTLLSLNHEDNDDASLMGLLELSVTVHMGQIGHLVASNNGLNCKET